MRRSLLLRLLGLSFVEAFVVAFVSVFVYVRPCYRTCSFLTVVFIAFLLVLHWFSHMFLCLFVYVPICLFRCVRRATQVAAGLV